VHQSMEGESLVDDFPFEHYDEKTSVAVAN
jgi:hypothetical protein